MNRKETEARLAELRAQREATAAELEQARDAVPQALIEGREPPEGGVSALAPLTEMLAALDAAIARLEDSLQGHRDAEARAGRRRQIEKAMEAASERRKKAKRVDDALADRRCGEGALSRSADIRPLGGLHRLHAQEEGHRSSFAPSARLKTGSSPVARGSQHRCGPFFFAAYIANTS